MLHSLQARSDLGEAGEEQEPHPEKNPTPEIPDTEFLQTDRSGDRMFMALQVIFFLKMEREDGLRSLKA